MSLHKYSVIGLLLFLFTVTVPAWAQRGSDVSDLSQLRVDNLSDAEIKKIQTEIEKSGLGADMLEQVAAARGMSQEEVIKLKKRMERIQREGVQEPNRRFTERLQGKTGRVVNNNEESIQSDQGKNESGDEKGEQSRLTARDSTKSRVFGASLFSNANPSFEPNLRLATPVDYQIGPDDEILIDIFGYSEASYQLMVSPDGTINVPLVGVIPVSGATMEQASSRIRQRLAKIYTGINNGSTNVSITLGNIRSIRVIVTGEVRMPGTFSLPSVATVFNALYACGGPSDNGSFRSIRVIRGGKEIANLDVYDFLLYGTLKNNIRLQDQDVIRVPTYLNRVEMAGEVKRPGIFETKAGETLDDLLQFSGGFNERAYKARIKVLRNTPTEREIQDITAGKFNSFHPESGDQFFVNKILERFTNLVTIKGAVFRGGQYELEPGLTLSQLINKAEGLREDAFLPRGYVIRKKEDLTTEVISFDVGAVSRGTAADITLRRDDVISISSIFDLREEYSLTVEGEVRKPGTFDFAENISLEELILQAGGFTESATPKRIEVSRRIRNREARKDTTATAEVFVVNVDQNLAAVAGGFQLEPFDMVMVRSAPGYEKQRVVRIDGEVLYPGLYAIKSKNERVSDLIARAGGLTSFAYKDGASLKRTGKRKTQAEQEQENLKLRQFQALQKAVDDSTQMNISDETNRNDYVGIDLKRILRSPGKRYDLLLEDGDVLNIPKQLQTVKVSGQVLSPSAVIYEPGDNFKSYIRKSGGFGVRALRRRAYIVYANGSIASTRKILLFNNFPSVKPGAEIYVPAKEERRNKLSTSEIVALSTGLATIATLIFSILR